MLTIGASAVIADYLKTLTEKYVRLPKLPDILSIVWKQIHRVKQAAPMNYPARCFEHGPVRRILFHPQDTNRPLWSFPGAACCDGLRSCDAPRRTWGGGPREGSKAAPLQSHGVASDAFYGYPSVSAPSVTGELNR